MFHSVATTRNTQEYTDKKKETLEKVERNASVESQEKPEAAQCQVGPYVS